VNQTIPFEYTIPYRTLAPWFTAFPALPVTLIGPSGRDQAIAILDTGAGYCLFNGTRAGTLGLDLMEGCRIRLSTMGGEVAAYLHEIGMEIEGHSFQIEVAFSSGPVRRELLGRHTLFERTIRCIRESRQEIYFSPKP
jgi:predicted aspartyl protease